MDIGLDDGRSAHVDLTKDAVARKFDSEVEDLCDTLDDIVKNMHGPQGMQLPWSWRFWVIHQNTDDVWAGASISKIHAKEILQAVSQRISDTVRSRPKAKRSIFDSAPVRGQMAEDLSRERKGMGLFLKSKPTGSDW